MKTILFAGASVGLCILASAAQAQSIDYGAMEQLFNEPVTTSATGSPQRSTEVPVAMEIISAADIERSGAVDLPTILQRVAGLDVVNWTSGNADVSVRGYNHPMASRLLVLINGRQVYLDHYGYTAWAALPVQLSEIRQIEVVKGPNSALFGFNAVGGVVNIITFNPKFDDVGSVTASVGNGGYKEVSLVHTAKIGDRFSARLSLGASERDQWKNTRADIPTVAIQQPARVSANLDTVTQLDDKTELRVEGSWSNSQISERVSNNTLRPARYLTDSIKATLTSDSRIGLVQVSAYQNNLVAKSLATTSKARFENTISVLSAQDLFKVGTKHTFRVGAEYRKNEVSTAPLAGSEVSYDVMSASGMWNWAVTTKLSTTLAVRYDKLDLQRSGPLPDYVPATTTNALWDRSIKEVSYNAGAVYRPTDLDSIRLTAARGVQVPTLIDLGAIQVKLQLPTGPVGVIGNPNLQPTIVTNYELAYDRTLPALNAKVGASVFLQKNQDIKGQPTPAQIDLAATASSLPLISFRNIGDSKMKGVEVRASGALEGGFHWSGDYTWTDVTDTPAAGYNLDIRFAPYAKMTPSYRANVALGWAKDQWTVDGYAHFVGKTLQYSMAQRLASVDAYTSLSGRIARKFDGGFTVALSGQNLAKSRQTQTLLLQAERQVLLSVTKAW